MKIVNEPLVQRLYDKVNITIAVDKASIAEIEALRDELTVNEEYILTVKKKRGKRSLDANGYAWQLMSKLAAKTGKSAVDIYREQIKDMYTYTVVCVQNRALERTKELWEGKGIGWIAEELGAARNVPECTTLRLVYGSSVFNTKEMSDLIDKIVYECQQFGIETATPDELERIKSTWR